MGTPIRLITVAALLATSSCTLPNLLAPGNPVDFCIEQAKAYCDMQFRCCTAQERTGDPLGVFRGPAISRWAPSDAGECVGVISDICRGEIAEQNESVTEERVKYDADEAASCLDELHQAVDECKLKDFFKADGSYLVGLVQNGQPGIFGGACEDAVKGEVDDGDTCFAQYECKRGFCNVDTSNGDVTLKGECTGDGHPENPFANTTFKVEICDGLGDEASQ